MRHVLTCLLLSTVAASASAQVLLPQPNTVQPSTVQPQQPAPVMPVPTATVPLDEVGYDAKVKRDPYGNVIGEKKQVTAPKTETQKLRRDTNLRSDRKTIGQRPVAAPAKPAQLPLTNAVGAPLITPSGAPLTIQNPGIQPPQSTAPTPVQPAAPARPSAAAPADF